MNAGRIANSIRHPLAIAVGAALALGASGAMAGVATTTITGITATVSNRGSIVYGTTSQTSTATASTAGAKSGSGYATASSSNAALANVSLNPVTTDGVGASAGVSLYSTGQYDQVRADTLSTSAAPSGSVVSSANANAAIAEQFTLTGGDMVTFAVDYT